MVLSPEEALVKKHSLLQGKEEDVIREIAEDISNIISKKNTSTYIAIPDMIFKRVMERISPAAKAKITKTLETDLMKTDKMDLVDLFR